MGRPSKEDKINIVKEILNTMGYFEGIALRAEQITEVFEQAKSETIEDTEVNLKALQYMYDMDSWFDDQTKPELQEKFLKALIEKLDVLSISELKTYLSYLKVQYVLVDRINKAGEEVYGPSPTFDFDMIGIENPLEKVDKKMLN